MAEAIVSKVAKLLDDFAKYGKLWGVEGELDKLKETIYATHNMVDDAEYRSAESREIGAWLDDLKAAFYDAEDLLDDWNIEIMRRELPSKDENLKQSLPSEDEKLLKQALLSEDEELLKLGKLMKQVLPSEDEKLLKQALPSEDEKLLKQALPREDVKLLKQALPSEDVKLLKQALPSEDEKLMKQALPSQDEKLLKQALPSEDEKLIKQALPSQDEKLLKQALPSEDVKLLKLGKLLKQALPSEDEKLMKQALPSQDEKLLKQALPSEDVKLLKQALPNEDEKLMKQALPSEDVKLLKLALPSEDEKLMMQALPSEDEKLMKQALPSEDEKLMKQALLSQDENLLKQALPSQDEELKPVISQQELPSIDEKSKQVNILFSPSKELALELKSIKERIEAIAARWKDLHLPEDAEHMQFESRRGNIHSFSSEEEITRRDVAESATAAKGSFHLDLRDYTKDVQMERGSRKREQSGSFVYKEEIIGRDGAKSAIMKFLLDSDTEEKFSALSINGAPGIGKTALARCLYKDHMANKHFDLKLWVYVGYAINNFEMVLRKIIACVTTKRAGEIELEQLKNQLEEHIRGKKYLLVLDDIHIDSPEQWGSLKSLLMGGAQGSKILITTSAGRVAESMGTTSSCFLEALSESSSLDLFMRMACKEEQVTRDLKKLATGRQIVKACRGIPLAIRIIGSLLFFKKTEVGWLYLERKIKEVSAMPHFCFLTSLLELSYHHLPSHLKLCFIFCSLFPDGWVIDKPMLTSLWMAEGLIWPIDNVEREMEDIAHDYFMDLLRRNFFQDCTEDALGNVTSCKVHHLTNRLRCMSAETVFVQGMYQTWLSIGERIRHVSWDSTIDLSRGLPTTLLRAKQLRTFIKMDQTKRLRGETQMGEKTLCEFISSFQFLRALDWHDSGIEMLPNSICELKHLTFLDLSENEGIIRLPESITRLQTLQVLKLNMCYKLIELPRDIRKLVNLRQLEISNCSALSHLPHGLGQLTLLHTLTDFLLPGDDSCPKNCGGLRELSRLSNLRGSLRIEFKGETKDAVAESNAANLKEKDYLVSLILVFAGKKSDEVLLRELQPSLNLRSLEIRGYGGTWFPSWMSRMPKLHELRLFHCVGCKGLPQFGELPSLERLEIGELPIVEYTQSDLHTHSSLPNLPTLRIWNCPNLEWIPPLLYLKELKLPSFPLESLQTSVATIEHVTGTDDKVKHVIKLLDIENDEVGVRIVGIHGPNGIGKTTIAKAIYDQFSPCFDRCSFLAGIGETAQNAGGIQLVQTKLICDILERDGNAASFKGGIQSFMDVFHNIKILIVLDDVEEQSHLDDLVGDQLDWFGSGSRIIVTSENSGILQKYVSRNLARIYEVNEMDNDQALALFCRHTLGIHGSIPWYPEIGKRIIKATGQVPFVIEVIGSFLRGKAIEDWRKMEDLIKPRKENYRDILKDCREILKICYEVLDEKQKQIFWDIAWFANGVDSRIASYMWPDRDRLPSHHVLMPLAKIGEDNMLRLHKLLKHLSGTIDQEEPIYPGRRRRLYMHDTDLKVINRKEGMEEVEALCFDFKNRHPHTFTGTDFKSMPNIRFLKLDHASMTGNFANVFPKLRWLRWQGCPRDFDTTEFSLTELVILDLSWSKVTEDWGGWMKIKMEQLKVLNLTGCTDLLISPTFSSFPNLEILILERCSRLVHLDPSVGGLKKLLCLNLKSCTELNMLPSKLGGLKALKELLIDETPVEEIPLKGNLKKLETLSASNCLSLSLLPHSIEHLISLSVLSIDNSKITKLPNGVGELVKLQRLSLRDCRWIRKLPESIGQLGSSLEELDMSGTGISDLPNSFGKLRSLRVLKMDSCFMKEFPSFIGRLHSLEEIHASSCRSLKGEIPTDIGNLIHLRILRLQHSGICSLPSEIKHLSKLETLDLLHCDMLDELPGLPSGLVNVRLSPKLKEKLSNL